MEVGNTPGSPENHGIEITGISNSLKPTDNSFVTDSKVSFFIDKTDIEFFSSTLLGKFDRNNRVIDAPTSSIVRPPRV